MPTQQELIAAYQREQQRAANGDQRMYPSLPTLQNGGLPAMSTGVPPVGTALPTGDPLQKKERIISYARVPLDVPYPWLPYTNDGSSGQQLRYVTLTTNCPADVAVNQEIVRQLMSDFSAAIVECVATVKNMDPLNLDGFNFGDNPLDLFTVSLKLQSGDRLIPEATLGGAFFGSPGLPRKLVGPAWKLAGSASPFNFVVVPLRTNIRVDLCFTTIDVIIGSNF